MHSIFSGHRFLRTTVRRISGHCSHNSRPVPLRRAGGRKRLIKEHTNTAIIEAAVGFNRLNLRNISNLVVPCHETLGISVDTLYLRDACPCSRCVDPSTSQKLFESATIPLDIEVESYQILPDGCVEIVWKNDAPGYRKHKSTFPPEFFANHSRTRHSQISPTFPCRVSWDCAKLTDHARSVTFDEFLNSERALHGSLNQLHRFGIVFLHSIPLDPSAIERIAARIGPLRNTFYGATWHVRSVPAAKNIAYTSHDLGFHMDLLYMEDPPGLQILHTMKASAHGGESLFSDGLRALHMMGREDPELTSQFGDYRVTYRYKNDGHWYQQTRQTVENRILLDIAGRERPNRFGPEGRLNWSPPFQGPFDHDARKDTHLPEGTTDLRLYIKGAKLFKKYLEAESAVFETKMGEGTCAIFDNRRILHARKAYDNESERWLRGAYVDKDPFWSRLRMLNMKFGSPGEDKVEAASIL